MVKEKLQQKKRGENKQGKYWSNWHQRNGNQMPEEVAEI